MIPCLYLDVAPRHRNEAAVMRHAVLGRGLGRRHLVVRGEREPAICQGEDRVPSPILWIGGAAAWLNAATPLVGKQDLIAVVVEGRRVKVGEVGIRDLIGPHGVYWVGDVEQDAI